MHPMHASLAVGSEATATAVAATNSDLCTLKKKESEKKEHETFARRQDGSSRTHTLKSSKDLAKVDNRTDYSGLHLPAPPLAVSFD